MYGIRHYFASNALSSGMSVAFGRRRIRLLGGKLWFSCNKCTTSSSGASARK